MKPCNQEDYLQQLKLLQPISPIELVALETDAGNPSENNVKMPDDIKNPQVNVIFFCCCQRAAVISSVKDYKLSIVC